MLLNQPGCSGISSITFCTFPFPLAPRVCRLCPAREPWEHIPDAQDCSLGMNLPGSIASQFDILLFFPFPQEGECHGVIPRACSSSVTSSRSFLCWWWEAGAQGCCSSLLLPAPPCSFLLSRSPGSAALAGTPPAVASCIVFHFSPVLKSSSLVPSEVIN